jgi:uncharacterized protein YjeT (DUF2065 family)
VGLDVADLATALGLVLVIEGVLYALAPEGMRSVLRAALDMPSETMRRFGLGAAMLGLVVVWLVRG